MGRITLWGMYQYEPKLFEGAVLPPLMNKEIFINYLMRKCGQLFPWQQEPHWLRTNISIWFQGHLEDFDRMYKAMTAEYSPIENYDRYEWSKRDYDNSGIDTVSDSGTDTLTNSGQDKSHADMTSRPNLVNTTSVSAFDQETGFTPREQIENNGQSTTEDESTFTHGKVESTKYGKTQSTNHGHQIDDEYSAHMHGNIGVTTNQQMIEQELALRENNNVYDIIVRMFEREFLMRNY